MSTHSLTIQGSGSFEVEAGKKLTLAIEEAGVDVSHRCGGKAKCTTCRVKFLSEEPPMGIDEKESLEEDGVLGEFRLSCQIRVDRPMEVEVLMLASVQGWEPGPAIEE